MPVVLEDYEAVMKVTLVIGLSESRLIKCDYQLNKNNPMGIILWIIFGALVGWIASIIMSTDEQQGVILNVVVGIVGAIIGGWLMSFFGESGVSGFNLYSFIVALVGAVVLISAVKLIRN